MAEKIEDLALVDVVAEIRRLAGESPDYVYQRQGCVYVEEDDAGNLVGSCIVGKALVNLGVEPQALHYEVPSRIPGAAALLRRPVDDLERRWIDEVQYSQDFGYAWSESVANADAEYPLEAQS